MPTKPILALLSASEGGNPLLQQTPGLSLWTLGVFLLLLVVLWRYGWGMLISKLDARDRAIRGAIDLARRDREEGERFLAEQKTLLDQSRRESAQMLATAQQEAGQERQRLVEQARQEYDQIVTRGREQIEQETRAALAQVRAAMAGLAVEVASRLIQKNLDPAGQARLVEDFLKELEAKGPQA